MKEIYEMKGAGRSVRGIADELGIARNTVRRYLKSPEAISAKPRPQRASKLDPYTGYVDHRLDEGLENCVVLHRELAFRTGVCFATNNCHRASLNLSVKFLILSSLVGLFSR